MGTQLHHRKLSRIAINRTVIVSLMVLVANVKTGFAQSSNDDIWQQLQQGQVVALMRHAIAPGTGDPVNFSVNDCTTQRNLSSEGVRQAQAIGDAFRSNGVRNVALYSSQWCRCVDTATHLDIGQVQTLPAINSFFADRTTAAEQTEKTQNIVLTHLEKFKNAPGTDTIDAAMVLVTHQVNITALVDVFPASGEIIFVHLSNAQLAVVDRVLIAD